MFDSQSGHAETLSPLSITVEESFGVFPDLVFVLNQDYVITEFRAGNAHDLYVPPEQFLGQSMCKVLPIEAAAKISAGLEKARIDGDIELVEYRLIVQDTMKWFEARISKPSANRYIMLVRDVTEHKSKEAHILYQATHDHLTGLYNRAFAFDFIDKKLQEAQRQQTTTALLFVDLDNFKTVNDTLGHDIGDDVIKAAAKAIKHSVREQDLVSRIGGDEFLVAVVGHLSVDNIRELAEKLKRKMSTFAKSICQDIEVSASIGVAFCDNGELSVSELIKRADTAMYRNKSSENGSIEFYTAE